MPEANQNHNEMLGALTARLDELATCLEKEFNPDHAVDALEESVGGSLASSNRHAAINEFSIADIDHLETVVRRFDRHPPALHDNQDLELYTNLIEEAQELIQVRREQIDKELKLGGREARISFEMSDQKRKQVKLFLDTAHNSLNAAGDIGRIRTKQH